MTYEYEVECDTCGVIYRVGLRVPAESLGVEALAQILDDEHPAPLCAPATGVVYHSEPRDPEDSAW